jgi:hypothetical protein
VTTGCSAHACGRIKFLTKYSGPLFPHDFSLIGPSGQLQEEFYRDYFFPTTSSLEASLAQGSHFANFWYSFAVTSEAGEFFGGTTFSPRLLSDLHSRPLARIKFREPAFSPRLLVDPSVGAVARKIFAGLVFPHDFFLYKLRSSKWRNSGRTENGRPGPNTGSASNVIRSGLKFPKNVSATAMCFTRRGFRPIRREQVASKRPLDHRQVQFDGVPSRFPATVRCLPSPRSRRQ